MTEATMGVNRTRNDNGEPRIEVSRNWPCGAGRFRRYFPNLTTANEMLAKINGAIANNTWRELKRSLDRGPVAEAYTVETFWVRFRDQHCKPRMRSWKRYELSFESLNKALGGILLSEFRRHHLHAYVERRSREESQRHPGSSVAANTVNRDITALKKMFSYAVDCGILETHPLSRFPMLPVQEEPIRVPTLAEYRHLVASIADIDPVVGVYVAVVGETGLRKKEALAMEWSWIDARAKLLTVAGPTKSKRVRHVPLSEYACLEIGRLARHISNPHVFMNPRSGAAWKELKKIFYAGREAAGMEWVTIHTLRHFRISEWVRRGIDLRTVQQMAGHQDIKTTMRYAHFAPGAALASMREAQEAEAAELRGVEEKRA